MRELLSELRESRREIASLRQEVAALQSNGHSGGAHFPEPIPNWEIKSAYTYQEAADIWEVGYRTVQGWVASKKVSRIQRGGPRIPHDEVMRVWRKGVR